MNQQNKSLWNNLFSGITPPVKWFIIKLLSLIFIWKVLYNIFLQPKRIPDEWLTNFITNLLAKFLNFFYSFNNVFSWKPDPAAQSAVILENGEIVFNINDLCNGLELIMIYVGLIILIPNNLKRKLIFIFTGSFILMMANVLRCFSLYWIFINDRSSFEFNHHYTFTFLMYLLIIGGWIWFSKNTNLVKQNLESLK